MRIVGFDIVTTLVEREKRASAQRAQALERRVAALRAELAAAKWKNAAEVKATFGSADPVGNNRIVFNLCGNHYRMIIAFNYDVGIARIRFAGTHAEYDEVSARDI